MIYIREHLDRVEISKDKESVGDFNKWVDSAGELGKKQKELKGLEQQSKKLRKSEKGSQKEFIIDQTHHRWGN